MMSDFRRIISFHGFAFLVTIGSMVGGWADDGHASHPNHVTNAEVNWNSKTGNFEVALCVWPVDLETVLTTQQGKPVDLDKSENVDAMIQQYIEKNFLIRRRVGNDDEALPTPKIRWVGFENNIKQAWLYFEIKTDDKTFEDWTIESRVFFELNEDQLNQVQFAVGRAKPSTIACTLESARQSLKAAEKTRRPW